jgi:hypothetical protein
MDSDPRTFWLTLTNIILGVLVLLAVLGVVTGVLCDLVDKLKRRHTIMHEIDDDMRRLFHGTRGRR